MNNFIDPHGVSNVFLFLRTALYPVAALLLFYLVSLRWHYLPRTPINVLSVLSHSLTGLFFMMMMSKAIIQITGWPNSLWLDTVNTVCVIGIAVVAAFAVWRQSKIRPDLIY